MPIRWSRPNLRALSEREAHIVSKWSSKTWRKSDVPCKLVPVDEFVVLVGGAGRLVLHFLGEVLEEAAPLRCGAELGHEVGGHLDALVREQHEAGPGYVVDVVDVVRGRDGREVSVGLFKGCFVKHDASTMSRTKDTGVGVVTHRIAVPDLDDLLVRTEHVAFACHPATALYPRHILHWQAVSLVLKSEMSCRTDIIQQRMSC